MPISWEDQFGETYIQPILKVVGGYGPGAALGYYWGGFPMASSGAQVYGMIWDKVHPTYAQREKAAKESGIITGSSNRRYGSINQVTGSSNRPPLKKVEYKDYRGSIWG